MLIEDGSIQLVRHIGYNVPKGKRLFRFNSIKALPENDLMRRAYERGEKTIAADTENSLGWVRSFVSTPLKIGNRVIGLLNIDSEIPAAFGEPEIEQLDIFANSAAVALNNARLYQDLEQALQTEKETRLQLIRADKLAGMGRMVASVAHELNNPLQTIKNCLFLIDQTRKENQDTDLLVLAMSEVERLSLIVNRLRDVYRPAVNQEFKTTELSPLLTDLEKLLETHLRRNNVTLDLAKGKAKGFLVKAIPDQMKQVFLNLSLNAIEAMQPDGGVLKVRVDTKKRKGLVGISFSDTGHGIPEQDLKVVFDPFYTTKTTGMGLGLSICYDIVQNHDGFIEVRNNADVGVTFTVWLPVQVQQETHPPNPEKTLSHKKDLD
jgi:signal transduction histidine kinase